MATLFLAQQIKIFSETWRAPKPSHVISSSPILLTFHTHFLVSRMQYFREGIIPKLISEFVALGFVLFIIPAIYIFELSVVIPALYPTENDSSFWLCFHSVMGSFLMFNLVGNLIGVIFVDTSSKEIVVDAAKVNEHVSLWLPFDQFKQHDSPKYRWNCRKDGTFAPCAKRMHLLERGTAARAVNAFWRGNITADSRAAVWDSRISVSFTSSSFTCSFRVCMRRISTTSSYGRWFTNPIGLTSYE